VNGFPSAGTTERKRATPVGSFSFTNNSDLVDLCHRVVANAAAIGGFSATESQLIRFCKFLVGQLHSTSTLTLSTGPCVPNPPNLSLFSCNWTVNFSPSPQFTARSSCVDYRQQIPTRSTAVSCSLFISGKSLTATTLKDCDSLLEVKNDCTFSINGITFTGKDDSECQLLADMLPNIVGDVTCSFTFERKLSIQGSNADQCFQAKNGVPLDPRPCSCPSSPPSNGPALAPRPSPRSDEEKSSRSPPRSGTGDRQSSSDTGLSTGAIVGIVFGVIGFIVVVVLIVGMIYFKRTHSQETV
jgi:hypothetical protein